MNEYRRKLIGEATALLEQAQDKLDEAAEGERDAFDNMPESLQGSERGQASETAADALESAAESVGEAIDYCATAEGDA